MTDFDLLREHTERRSEAALTALVERHVGLIYSAALRRVRDPQLAEEVTQARFIILARKARLLRRGTSLSGWLYRNAHFAANGAYSPLRPPYPRASPDSGSRGAPGRVWCRVGAIPGLQPKVVYRAGS